MKTLSILIALCATPAAAELRADFRESAPKDRFTFTNASACDIGPSTITLDLTGSAAGLIFDTTGNGAGVEVFQPYQTVAGAESLQDASAVADGDTTIKLTLKGLAPNQSVAFTIDVDDTLRNSSLGQIRVSDSEIAGASVTLATSTMQQTGTFDTSSTATLKTEACRS